MMEVVWLRTLWLLILALLPFCALSAPPAILLANVYRDGIDVSQYLVSEKLDGVRAVWDGKTLRFRSGNEVHAPAWFLEGLPRQPLDGELWMGRGSFERLSGIVRRDVPDDAEWHQVHYMIFELPNGEGTFSQRSQRIVDIVRQANVSWLRGVEQVSMMTKADSDASAVNTKILQKMLNDVVNAGGEGLMLHRADAAYETGRSDTLLKLKPFLDAEAVVVGYMPGKGKYAGMMGALRVQMPDGRKFSLGTGFSDAQRQTPPALGSTVTYRYRQLTRTGLPRFASFLRVRVE